MIENAMLPEGFKKLTERFTGIAFRSQRAAKVQMPRPKPTIDPVAEEASRMAEAARAPLTRKRILPWIRAQRKLAAMAIRQTGMMGGAATTYAVGYEAALNDVIEKFVGWAETSAPEVETRPMRPLEGVSK